MLSTQKAACVAGRRLLVRVIAPEIAASGRSSGSIPYTLAVLADMGVTIPWNPHPAWV